MEKTFDNTRALYCLNRLGYRRGEEVMYVRDAFNFVDPGGAKCKMKIHKSGVASGSNGRHRYGLTADAFPKVDYVVIWAEGEKVILIVPSSHLSGILDHNRGSASFVGGQWVVNVYFDDWGEQILVPCNFETRHKLTSFAHATSI